MQYQLRIQKDAALKPPSSTSATPTCLVVWAYLNGVDAHRVA